MKLFGDGRVAIDGDTRTAERLGWTARRRSRRVPEIVLRPRDGDPRREPWIAPPQWVRAAGAAGLWTFPRRGTTQWTYLPAAAGVHRYLSALAQERPDGGWSIGVAGLGRVGGTAAALLVAGAGGASPIREILVHDVDAANEERWLLELRSITAWGSRHPAPPLERASCAELYRRCDAVLFAATAGVPPIGSPGDVRIVQFEPNRKLLAAHLAAARDAGFTGLLLVVSDPVECLARAAFRDSNTDATGRFHGTGLAPERIAGLALGVMWGRALAVAREAGWDHVAGRGAAYGPHSTEVLVFDDLQAPDAARTNRMSRAAREGNLLLRSLGHLPYVGPASSSVALALPQLLVGREVLASIFLDGVYFGAPARLAWGVYPRPRRMAPAVREEIASLHRALRDRHDELGLGLDRAPVAQDARDGSTADANRTPGGSFDTG